MLTCAPCTHTHRHRSTCAYTQIYLYTLSHMNVNGYTCVYALSHLCAHTPIHLCKHTHMHTGAHTHTQCIHAYIHVQLETRVCTHMHTDTCVPAYACAHTIMPAHTCVFMYTLTPMHACTHSPGPLCILTVHEHSHICMLIPTNTQACTHFHTHTHMHTYMCAHSYILTFVHVCTHSYNVSSPSHTHVHVRTHHSEFRLGGVMGELPCPLSLGRTLLNTQ